MHVHQRRYEYVPADHREEPLADGESDDELTLEVGDHIRIVEDMDEDGFYQAVHVYGKQGGKQGLVPSNFLREATAEEAAAAEDVAGDDLTSPEVDQDQGDTAASGPASPPADDSDMASPPPEVTSLPPDAESDAGPRPGETDEERRAREEREHAAEIEKALLRKKKKNKNKQKK